jgi:hypothetical protein
MDIEEFSPGVLAIHANGKAAFVMEVNPDKKYPIVFKKNTDAKGTYHDAVDKFDAIIGNFDIDKFPKKGMRMPGGNLDKAALKAAVHDYLENVVGMNGTYLLVDGRTAKYKGWHKNRSAMPITAYVDGMCYRMRPSSVVLPKSERPEADIMKDIEDVYCQLSPENLTCDGERSRTEVNRHYRELQAKLRTLCTELGRDVNETEALTYGQTSDMFNAPLTTAGK